MVFRLLFFFLIIITITNMIVEWLRENFPGRWSLSLIRFGFENVLVKLYSINPRANGKYYSIFTIVKVIMYM